MIWPIEYLDLRTDFDAPAIEVVSKMAGPLTANSNGGIVGGHGWALVNESDPMSAHLLDAGLLIPMSVFQEQPSPEIKSKKSKTSPEPAPEPVSEPVIPSEPVEELLQNNENQI